jgi:hypothetical protein
MRNADESKKQPESNSRDIPKILPSPASAEDDPVAGRDFQNRGIQYSSESLPKGPLVDEGKQCDHNRVKGSLCDCVLKRLPSWVKVLRELQRNAMEAENQVIESNDR